MSKKILNSTLDTSTRPKPEKPVPATKAGKLSSQVLFAPTANMAKMKARFWTRFQPGPMTPIGGVTMQKAQEVTGSSSLKEWWPRPGFVEWFLNREEERERLKYLFNKSLDSVEEILDNPEANANAKANIVKLLAEMTGYLTKGGNQPKFADAEIEKMSENQLITFLEKKGVRITQETIIDAKKAHTERTEREAGEGPSEDG